MRSTAIGPGRRIDGVLIWMLVTFQGAKAPTIGVYPAWQSWQRMAANVARRAKICIFGIFWTLDICFLSVLPEASRVRWFVLNFLGLMKKKARREGVV